MSWSWWRQPAARRRGAVVRRAAAAARAARCACCAGHQRRGAAREGLALSPWLIKPNEELAAQARDLDPADAQALADEARRLNARIEHVVMSQAPQGSAGFAGCRRHAQPPKVRVVSTVGAGDSLLAGMLHGLLAGWPAERTLAHATAIAAQAVGQIGFGITDRAQLAELEAAVRLQPLSQ